ncbi:MAG: glutathione S-transferase N-terminal domain-containing protein [Gemmatimonadaceae bacterium]|nr:glutathione S-transferase N-terminal domain-containing protein [Acetobacteraceae bacterium]
MRTLMGRANSSNVMKAVWLMEELGVPYARTDVGGPFGGTGTPEYRALNPNGVIPTLVEDGFVLWESNAILRYICASQAPGHAIWPDDLHVRAGIDRWMDWQQTTLGPPQSAVFQALVRTPPDQRDPAALDAAMKNTARVWTLLDGAMGAHVAGPGFTLADIALGVHVHRWFSFDITRPAQPNLRAWYDRLLARPAYARHVAMPMT